jgi:hypothetical protein
LFEGGNKSGFSSADNVEITDSAGINPGKVVEAGKGNADGNGVARNSMAVGIGGFGGNLYPLDPGCIWPSYWLAPEKADIPRKSFDLMRCININTSTNTNPGSNNP